MSKFVNRVFGYPVNACCLFCNTLTQLYLPLATSVTGCPWSMSKNRRSHDVRGPWRVQSPTNLLPCMGWQSFQAGISPPSCPTVFLPHVALARHVAQGSLSTFLGVTQHFALGTPMLVLNQSRMAHRFLLWPTSRPFILEPSHRDGVPQGFEAKLWNLLSNMMTNKFYNWLPIKF